MPTIDVDARRWFDTLKPVNPPFFDVEHPDWCRRHWAPAIRLGGNGTAASMQLAQVVIGLIRGQLPAGTEISSAVFMQARADLGPWCCIAGDDLMYKIWARWTP